MKKILSLMFVGVLSLWAADFSKLDNEKLIEKASNLKANEVVDFRIEVHKRVKSLNQDEGKEFFKKVKKARYESLNKMDTKKREAYLKEVCKSFQAKTDSMSGKEIRESGLFVINDCEKFSKSHHKPHKRRRGEGEGECKSCKRPHK